MFKKLKKAVSGKPQRISETVPPKNYSAFSNSDTSSGDDSFYLPSAAQPVKTETNQKSDAVLNQVILNLGGDLGIMSLENESEYSSDQKTLTANDTTTASFYTTAVENKDQTLKAASKSIMDSSLSSDSDQLCVTALDNTEQCGIPVSQQKDKSQVINDPLEDCLCAFGGLDINSKPLPTNPMLSSLTEGDNVRRLSDGSAFCVIDFDAEGQPVEHTLHYLPTAGQSKPDENLPATAIKERLPQEKYTGAHSTSETQPQLKDLRSDTLVERNLQPPNLTPSVLKSQETTSSQLCNTNHLNSDDVDSDAAINSESFKDTLPTLTLPSAQSTATSLDSTPFLTPEADITFSEFDPFASKTTTEQDGPFSAPLAQVETDGDTTTSSDTLTSRTALEENLLDPNLAVDFDPSSTPTFHESNAVMPEFSCDNLPESAPITTSVNQNSNCPVTNTDIEDELLSMFSGMKLESKAATPAKQNHDKVTGITGITPQAESVSLNNASQVVSTDKISQMFNTKDSSAENELTVSKLVELKSMPQLTVLQEKQNLSVENESPKFKAKKTSKKDQSLLIENESEVTSVVKGSYAIDFSELDDPSFDPFSSKQALDNSPTFDGDVKGNDDLCKGDGAFPNVVTSYPDLKGVSLDHGDSVDITCKAEESNQETDENIVGETLPSKGAYSIDFSKLDDPNFDPFQTKPGKVEMVAPEVKTQDTKTEPSYIEHKPAIEVEELSKTEVVELNKGDNHMEKVVDSKDVESVNSMDLDGFDPLGSSKGLSISNTAEKFQDSEKPLTADEIITAAVQSAQVSVKNEAEQDYHQQEEKNDEHDDAPLSKGAYSINFDDPNFDPFKTKTAVSNEENLTSELDIKTNKPETVLLKPAEESETKNMFTENALTDTRKEVSKQTELAMGVGDVLSQKETPDDNEKSVPPTMDESVTISQPRVPSPTKTNPDAETTSKSQDIDEETPLPARGAYSIDFSKFDDPNFDPFKTTKGLSNEDDGSSVACDVVIDNVPAVKDVPKSTEEPQKKAKKKLPKKKVTKNPIKKTVVPKPEPEETANDADEMPVSRGAYSFDFSKFDDPNYDPFKTTKGLVNDGESPIAEISRTELEKNTSTVITEHSDISDKETGNETILANSPETKETSGQSIVKMPCTNEVIFEKPYDSSTVSGAQEPVAVLVSTEEVSQTSQTVVNVEFDPLYKQLDPVTQTAKASDDVQELHSDPVSTSVSNDKTLPTIDDVENADLPSKVGDIENMELPVTKGAYTIDYSKFDDPNFDPFETKKGVSLDGAVKPNAAEQQTFVENINASNDRPCISNSPEKIVEEATTDVKVSIESELTNETEEVSPPKGAYSIDFSKFDDPNFNPFETKTGVCNDIASSHPTKDIDAESEKDKQEPKAVKKKVVKTKTKKPRPKRVASPVKKPDESDEIPISKGAYSIDFSKFDDPNYDPFKTTKGLSNEDSVAAISQQQIETTNSEPEKVEITGKGEETVDSITSIKKNKPETKDAESDVVKKSSGSSKSKSGIKQKRKKPKVPDVDENTESNDAPPKGAYSIDFSQFDDPNFDPFKTGGGLSNDDAAVVKNKPEHVEVPEAPADQNEVKKSPAKRTVPKKSFKKKTQPSKIDPAPPEPTEKQEEDLPAKGAYQIDFSKFDDPNFDPFKTGKSLTSDDRPSTIPSDLPADIATVTSVDHVIAKSETHTDNNEDTHTEEQKTTENPAFEGQQIDADGFRPANEIFGSEDNLSGWEKLWEKQDNAPEESALRKQSLYVQFDPLVQKRSVMDNRIPLIQETEENVSCIDYNATQTNANEVTNIIDQNLDNMTTFETVHQHPAASQLARNLHDEGGKWNSFETPTAKLLDLSLSPRPEGSSKTTFSAVRSEVESSQGLHENEDFVKQSIQELDKENERLRNLEADLLRQIEEEKKCRELTEQELLARKRNLEADLTRVSEQHDRVIKEFQSSVNVFEDYYKRTKKLVPTVFALKKADDELRQTFEQKAALLKAATAKYSTLKKEADSTINRLETEVTSASNDARRRIGAVEAQIKKEQMATASLEKQLENTMKENAELVKICEEFFSQADKK